LGSTNSANKFHTLNVSNDLLNLRQCAALIILSDEYCTCGQSTPKAYYIMLHSL